MVLQKFLNRKKKYILRIQHANIAKIIVNINNVKYTHSVVYTRALNSTNQRENLAETHTTFVDVLSLSPFAKQQQIEFKSFIKAFARHIGYPYLIPYVWVWTYRYYTQQATIKPSAHATHTYNANIDAKYLLNLNAAHILGPLPLFVRPMSAKQRCGLQPPLMCVCVCARQNAKTLAGYIQANAALCTHTFYNNIQPPSEIARRIPNTMRASLQPHGSPI